MLEKQENVKKSHGIKLMRVNCPPHDYHAEQKLNKLLCTHSIEPQ